MFKGKMKYKVYKKSLIDMYYQNTDLQKTTPFKLYKVLIFIYYPKYLFSKDTQK